MARVWVVAALGAPCPVVCDLLWPPSLSGSPNSWGNFDSSWQIFEDLSAQREEGARTVGRRAQNGQSAGKLMVHLSGTYNIPQEYSTLLKRGVSYGFDTIGLNYGWGPTTDSARSAQCLLTDSCEQCQSNYHEVILTGKGDDLLTGRWPIFGDNQTETLKWVHFYGHNVQFIPEHIPPPGVDLTKPLTQKELDYLGSLADFAIEPLLGRVLQRLGWSEYLALNGRPDWSKVVVTGHSQGASHSAYIAYARPVLGAMSFAGPQDMCGSDGGSWFANPAPDNRRAFACYAEDEKGRPAIESNIAFFSEVRTFVAGGKPRNYGPGVWCPSPEHCASAVDDQLVEDAVDRCFTLLQVFEAPKQPEEPSSSRAHTQEVVSILIGMLFCMWSR